MVFGSVSSGDNHKLAELEAAGRVGTSPARKLGSEAKKVRPLASQLNREPPKGWDWMAWIRRALLALFPQPRGSRAERFVLFCRSRGCVSSAAAERMLEMPFRNRVM